MRAFAVIAMLLVGLGESTNPFENVSDRVTQQVGTVQSIRDREASIIESSKHLESLGNQIAAALATYGTPEFQENMRKQVEAVTAVNGAALTAKKKQIDNLKARVDKMVKTHTKAKEGIAKRKATAAKLEQEKEKNDALVTEQLKLLVEAQSGYERALELAQNVTEHMQKCKVDKEAQGTVDLKGMITEIKARAERQGEQITKLKFESMNARASATSEKRLTETFSEHNNFADAANKAMGSERVLRDDQYPSLLDEASAVRLRASSKTRARARARSIPATAEAKTKLQELKESMLAREAYLEANLEKLANLKYGPTDEPTMLDKRQAAALMNEMKSYDKRIQSLEKAEESTAREQALERRQDEENTKMTERLRGLIKAQNADLRTAQKNAKKLNADIEKVEKTAKRDLSAMKKCQQEAMKLAVEAAALKCIEDSSNRIIDEELAEARDEKDEADREFMESIPLTIDARSQRDLIMVES